MSKPLHACYTNNVLTQVKHETASFIAINKKKKSVQKIQLNYSGTNKHLATGLCNTENVNTTA
jgi:hypothetical protein